MFKGTNQPWRLGAFFGDEKFAVHKNWTGCMRELEGACNQNSMAADTSITKELTNNLYNSKKVLGNGTESKGIENKKSFKTIVKLNILNKNRFGVCTSIHLSAGKGFDLGAINIQRGRDHGLASYNEVRRAINLQPITSMEQAPAEISSEDWDSLSKAYMGHLEDIDLYPGGLAEKPLPGISFYH